MGRVSKTIAFLVGFLGGVLAFPLFQPPWFLLCPASLGSLTALIAFRKIRFSLVFVGLLGLSLGFARARVSEHQAVSTTVDFYNGQKVRFEGVVTETDVRRDGAKYTAAADGPLLGPDGKPIAPQAAGNVLIAVDKYPAYHYGDRLQIDGLLEAPGTFEDFSYEHYLSRYGVYSVMRRPRIRLLATGEGNAFFALLSSLQEAFNDRINTLFPEPQGSLEAGLLIGARRGIPPEWTDRFNTTGLSHIVAISGFNITIILSCVLGALRPLPRKLGFWMAVAAVFLFTLFVGASPSVTRAAIMGTLGLLALHQGRQGNVHLTVLWTAFFMTFWNPKILWWDVGFQLSFAAVLGLIYVAPWLEPWFRKLPETLGIREALQMTLSAQVMALPIIAYHFGRLSLISPASNLLVGFAIPPAMLLGFLALIASFLFRPLALVFSYLTSAILTYILQVVRLLSEVPHASLDFKVPYLAFVAGYYGLLIALLVSAARRKKVKVETSKAF